MLNKLAIKYDLSNSTYTEIRKALEFGVNPE
jgi:hypothetical protein